MAAQQQVQQQIKAFEAGTDFRFIQVGSQAFTAGGSQLSFTLDKTGYLNELYLVLTGTMNLGGTGAAYAALGPWNILKNINVFLNLNNTTVLNLSGYELYLVNSAMQSGWAPDVSTDASLYAAPIASGNNAWNLVLKVPIAMNINAQRRYGVINLQDPRVQMYCQVTPGGNLDALTSIEAGTGLGSATLSLYQGIWEVPPAGYEQLGSQSFPQSIHKLLSFPTPVTFTGQQRITVPRDAASLMRLYFYALTNGARTTSAWTNFQLAYNITNTPVNMDAVILRTKMRTRTGIDWVDGASAQAAPRRAGAFLFDRWTASHTIGAGAFWDFIHLPNISQVDFLPTLSSSQSLASGDFMSLIREELEVPQLIGA